MKVTRAVGQGFSATHKGWPIIAVIFVFYAVIRFFSAPNEEIPPYLKSLGDWGIAALIFLAMCLGINYIIAGVQAYARDGIRDGRYGFKGFFRNCNKFFFVQLGISFLLSIPMWTIAFLAVFLLGGAISVAERYIFTAAVLGTSAAVMSIVLAVVFALASESWSIAAADGRGIIRSIGRSFAFCGQRFFGVIGLLMLICVSWLLISLVVWIAYAFILQGFRYLGLEGYGFILREVTGCALYAYFILFAASSLMAYYLNNRKEDERHN
ncbi:MAG TPA: hypothetical protein PLV09_01165 [Candidatus Omnitrophota bacterium]|nr:hypothetical protein [Candidatus Omnitrophota bacterium]HRZ67682.1 hypothetical protein [Candidatus Omnitrophota bacterium]